MFRRRSYLSAVAGVAGVSLAGCASIDDPEEADGSDESTGSGLEPGDSGNSDGPTLGTDEFLKWPPAETARLRFRSYELMAADDAISATERPTVGDVPVLATLEFTGADTADGESPPTIRFLQTTPESPGDRTTYGTGEYAAVIDTALDDRPFVDAYEENADRLIDVDGDVETAYEGVAFDYQSRCIVDPDLEYATVTVSSTDGDVGELAVVFENEPTDPDIDAVREDVPGVGDIAGTGDRLVVFEYTASEGNESDS